MTITKLQKTEFLCVRPKTSKAKNRFANEMDLLHSCRVESEMVIGFPCFNLW